MKRSFFAFLLLIMIFVCAAAQAQNVPISQLPPGGTYQPNTDMVPIARCATAGCNFKVFLSPLASLGVGNFLSGLGGNLNVVTGTNGHVLSALDTNNTYSGTSTFSGPVIFSQIGGSTQCLHVNFLGQISGTGADCGSGGSGSNAISALLGANVSNSIENFNFAQIWNWDTLGSNTALALSSTGMTSGTMLSIAATTTSSGKGISVVVSGTANTGYAGYFSDTSSAAYAGYFNGNAVITAGLMVGSPTGGLPSSGIINAQGLQINGVAVTPGGSPAGSVGALQISAGSAFGALVGDTFAAYTAHDTIMNGKEIDPRNPAYGAICGGYNTFTGDGSTKTFTYTIPFYGSSSTDNSNFFVFYEQTTGGGTATILNTSQFSVTGVLTPGSFGAGGGTITLSAAVPVGSTLIVVHDDGPAFIAASTAAVASGGYVNVPKECTIYTSQTNGTQLAEGAQLIGQNFTPDYGFQGQGAGPDMRVIAPTGFAPNFGFNVGNKSQQFFEGFEITTSINGAGPLQGLGFLTVPVLIGSNDSTHGAGGGQSPGITAQYMTFDSASVGFGSPIGGNSNYIFSVLRFNNFVANNAGVYGPLSDPVLVGNDFTQNGGFGTLGSAGGWVIGPQQAANGPESAGRAESNRFEFNREGVITQAASFMNFEGNQFDGNTECGLDLRGYWSNLSITGGWFRGNANGGTHGVGVTTPGQDADICASSTNSGSGGLFVSNVMFQTNYGEGDTAPIGSANAATPPYVLDVSTTGSWNDNIVFSNGSMPFVVGNNGASVIDTKICRNGCPTHLTMENVAGQANQGTLVNGNFTGQVRGIPSNQWTGLYVIGDASSYNEQITPITAGYGNIVATQMGTSPTYKLVNDYSHFDCDVVDLEIAQNPTSGTLNANVLINPGTSANPLIVWLPTPQEASYGGGFYTSHLADTLTCHLGALTWMTIPRANKVYAQQFTNTGSWTNDTHYTLPAGVTSNTNGDTSVGTITTNGGPIYLWYKMDTTSGGTFSWQLDSSTTGSVTVAGNNALGTGTVSLGAVRIPVGSAASHTISSAITSTTSTSNAVTLYGIATPPGKAYSSKAPVAVIGGQVPANGSASFPTAVLAFNTAFRDQASMLDSDGLMVPFADVENYWNAATDTTSGNKPNASGQLHIAHAYTAVIQPVRSGDGAIDPRDYGASANSLFFTNSYCTVCNAVSTTASSPVVSVGNYTFQPGVATQIGGGDVGKMFCIGPGGGGSNHPEIGCSCIISVNTTANTATLNHNALTTTSNHYAVMGGYPTNPSDPTTCQDDTIPTQIAGNAALLNGGKVFLPSNLMIHNLVMPGHIWAYGSGQGDFYESFAGIGYNRMSASDQPPTGTSSPEQATMINCALSGSPDDTQQCIQMVGHTRFSDFMIRAPTFPFTPFILSAACIGYSTSGLGPSTEQLLTNISYFGCPVDVGQAYGYNHEVDFTGSIADNGNGTSTMTVTSINSTNFNTADSWSSDFLAPGRPVSGTGVTSGTTITTVPPGGGTGAYILNKGMTVSSEALVSANSTGLTEIRDDHSQHAIDGIAYNGDFSDSYIVNSFCTGTFMNACWHLGPSVSGSGNAGNRWIGGRMEEVNTTAGLVCDGCDVQVTGADFDFNGAYNIKTLGGNPTVQVTGGAMHAGGHCNAATQDKAMISVGGSNPNISVVGVELTSADFGSSCGGTTTYLFSTATGSGVTSGGYIEVSGGVAKPGATMASITGVYNTTNGTPLFYKQNLAGWPLVDTTQTALGITVSGAVSVGNSLSVNNTVVIGGSSAATTGSILDLSLNSSTTNSSFIPPKGSTANRPASPVAGMERYNTDNNTLEVYTSAWGPIGSTTDTIVAKTSNYSVQTADSSITFTNTGATGIVIYSLPTVAAGLKNCFVADPAQIIEVVADSGHTIRNGPTTTSAGGNLTSDGSSGDTVCVKGLNSTEWFVTSMIGGWGAN